MAVAVALVLPFAVIPSYLDAPWWVDWSAPVAWAALLFVWVKIRFGLAKSVDADRPG
jgi:hypothetical protein